MRLVCSESIARSRIRSQLGFQIGCHCVASKTTSSKIAVIAVLCLRRASGGTHLIRGKGQAPPPIY